MSSSLHIIRLGQLSLTVAVCFSVVSCGTGSDQAARITAIQTALDTKPPSHEVPNGRSCFKDPGAYRKIAYVHIKKDESPDFTGSKTCFFLSWEPSVHLTEERIPITGSVYYTAPIGRFVVDKIGTEADVTTGFGTIKATPFKAHFQQNDVGKELIGAGIATPAPDITDGQVALHKDADGKWLVTQ